MAEAQKNFKSMFQIQLNLENQICLELDLCKGIEHGEYFVFESGHYDTMHECFKDFKKIINDLQIFFCQFDFMNVTKKYSKTIMGDDNEGNYVDLPKDHAMEVEIADSSANTVLNARVMVIEQQEQTIPRTLH